jgi:L-serine dehydratase
MTKAISLFNDVLGPIMRGPSSSHTAAPFQIGATARALLGGVPAAASFTFDPGGSFARVYHEQGSDQGFAAGVLGWSLTDERFPRALELAAAEGVDLAFRVAPLPEADHPNTVAIALRARDGRTLEMVANSVGGGAFVFTQVAGWPVRLTGNGFEVLVELRAAAEGAVRALLASPTSHIQVAGRSEGQRLLHAHRLAPLPPKDRARLEALPGVTGVWTAPPVLFPLRGLAGIPGGTPLFSSATEMLAYTEAQDCSLGEAALAYESALLGLPPAEVLAETLRRYEVMRAAVARGLGPDLPPMQLLQPSAGRIFQAEREGGLAVGGLHTRAAARAMAVMHVNGGMGVVCAAPTAGSAGTLPGVVVTLAEEMHLDEAGLALALLAASAVGLVVATRATFAAEVAGCQVEIGAAGAMGAAAVVEAAGGSPQQAADAAAIAFQNTMGSVCDLVQGIVEIPCHTRNAAAAANAFLCADLILGGYHNPIPLDETVDAVYAVGQMLPCELKVTALGGLALAPSARALPRLRQD